jgi:2-oxo-3-hexenedioate decarboxylase
MNHPDLLAAELLDTYDRGGLTTPPSARGPFSIAEAYAVGRRLVALRRARGERAVGRKIGFTNTSIWAEYGVDRPLWAHVYAGTMQDAEHDTATVSLAGIVAPRIEPEIVFGLQRAVAPRTADLEALLDHIAWYAAGFEITLRVSHRVHEARDRFQHEAVQPRRVAARQTEHVGEVRALGCEAACGGC